MSKIIAALVLMAAIYICATLEEKRELKEIVEQVYSPVDTAVLKYSQKVYVPVHVSERKGSAKPHKTILKIRNTSFSDTIYLSRIEYYDLHGNLLQNFIDSAVLVKPMATSEIVVKADQFKQRGDNFIVEWRANRSLQPLIQSLGLDQYNKHLLTDQGILLQHRLME